MKISVSILASFGATIEISESKFEEIKNEWPFSNEIQDELYDLVIEAGGDPGGQFDVTSFELI